MDKTNGAKHNQKQAIALNIRLRADQIAIYERARKNIKGFTGELPGASQTLLAGLIAIAENNGGLALDHTVIKRSANKARHNIADWHKKQAQIKEQEPAIDIQENQESQEDDTLQTDQ